MAVRKGLLMGMGNPLLDISNSVTRDYLAKYGLKDDDAILAEDKHKVIFEELTAREDTEYIPGGATQNGIRVAQWILRLPGATSMTGCVQKDKFGTILEEKCAEVGVNTFYQYNTNGEEPTGKCAVLIVEDKRSLVTELASANCFNISHLEDPENWKIVEEASFYYSASFFLTVSPPSLMKVAQHADATSKTLIMNLSAPFLVQFFKDPMMEVFPYVDILFGNETEALTFSKEHGFGTECVKEIAVKLSQLPKKQPEKARLVVITCGYDPVVVAMADQVTEYPVKTMPLESIVDTNGAGDAFVGGFLSQFVQGKPLSECVECGIVTAQCIIARSGCTYPADPAEIGY